MQRNIATTKNIVIGLHDDHVLALHPFQFRRGQLKVQGRDNVSSDFVLRRENVAHLPIEPFRPEVRTRFGVDELCQDTDAVVGAADTTFEHVPDSEIAPNFLNVHCFSLVDKGRVPGDHGQASDPGKRRDDVFGNAVRKVHLGWIITQIVERKHGY